MKWLQGKVIGQTEWHPGLFSIFIEAPPISFQAGQFVQLSLNSQEKHFRPYSLLNAPDDPVIEIYYTLVKQGLFTPALASLSTNSPIWVSAKASGRFVLDEVSQSNNLWCFATGTGLGPFLSILKTSEPWQRFKKIILVHSVRYHHELTHQSFIESWQEKYPEQFRWCGVVTREQVAHTLNNRIPMLLQTRELENTVACELSLQDAVMLCGNPSMVSDVTQILLQRGMRLNQAKEKGQITIESYWKNKIEVQKK
ncbi:MAG: ferredoxin--NADP reductase [Proteobacteria bacterium]|nr:ferredoxin--NADP reductase [Pseudomonadota bacterium]